MGTGLARGLSVSSGASAGRPNLDARECLEKGCPGRGGAASSLRRLACSSSFVAACTIHNTRVVVVGPGANAGYPVSQFCPMGDLYLQNFGGPHSFLCSSVWASSNLFALWTVTMCSCMRAWDEIMLGFWLYYFTECPRLTARLHRYLQLNSTNIPRPLGGLKPWCTSSFHFSVCIHSRQDQAIPV